MTRILFLLFLGASIAQAQTPRGNAAAANLAVRAAALGYIEGFYEGDTAKLIRSLHPDLSKYGFWRDTADTWSGSRMSFAQALDYARRVKARSTPVRAEWPKDVMVMEILERTAVAKITAWWGVDYLLLGVFDGEWKILQVIWEGPARSDVGRELRERYATQDTAIVRRDLALFISTLAPDYGVVLRNGRRLTRPAIDSAIARDMRATRAVRLARTDIEDVRVRGDTAIAVVVHRADRDLADANGVPHRYENTVRHEERWVKSGGRWRIVGLVEREQLLMQRDRKE